MCLDKLRIEQNKRHQKSNKQKKIPETPSDAVEKKTE